MKISKFNRKSNSRLRQTGNVIDYAYILFLVSWIDNDYSKSSNRLRNRLTIDDYD